MTQPTTLSDQRQMILLWQPLDSSGNPDGDAAAIWPENIWTRNAGIKADVWTAQVLFTEFDTIVAKLGQSGRVEVYTTNDPTQSPEDGSEPADPDFMYETMRIVDVEKVEVGIPFGQSNPRVTMYRI